MNKAVGRIILSLQKRGIKVQEHNDATDHKTTFNKERRIMAKSTIAHTEHIFQEPIQRVFHKPEPPGVCFF